jgi:hypothetical protein
MNKILNSPYLHPILFAIGFVLFFFAHNIEEVPFTDTILPLALVSVVITGLILIVRATKKDAVKCSLILSLFVLVFFSFGYIRDLFSSIGLVYINVFGLNLQNQIVLLPLVSAIFVVVSVLIWRVKSSSYNASVFLNIVAIVFVVISLFNIAVYAVNNFGNKVTQTSQVAKSVTYPDIYYIILDGYARQDVLKDCYNFDNSEFINYLRDKGFYVADNSTSNYNTTHLSMPSSLNMKYLKPADVENAYKGWGDNEVSEILKSFGYKTIFISGNAYIKGMDKQVDNYLVYQPTISDFSYGLLKTTALWPIYRFGKSLFGVEDELAEQYRQAILYAFDESIKVPEIKEPTFAYIHILCPHPPYIFKRDGSPAVSDGDKTIWQEGLLYQPDNPVNQFEGHESGYIEQVIFMNSKVKVLLDEVLRKSDYNAIIILQADHGMRIQKDRAYDILDAYYFPWGGYRNLYQTISPVNSFRVVLNAYFGEQYKLLPDEKREVEE